MPADPTLDEVRLRELLLSPPTPWTSVVVVPETGSTNADLAARAAGSSEAGAVLVAEHQTRGRGRLTRQWTAPPGTALATSVHVVPHVAVSAWTWLPLLVGLAVRDGIAEATGLLAELKWPNDVLVDGRKLCGILAERADGPAGVGSIIGFGINVAMTAEQLPVPTATSVLLECRRAGVPQPDPTDLLAAVLRSLGHWYARWDRGEAEAVRGAYTTACGTLGRRVRVVLSGTDSVEGVAESLDADGRVVVRHRGGLQAFGAGDIVHLR